MRVENKREMYKLLQAGAFGNYVPTWKSMQACVASGYEGPVMLRSMIPGGRCEECTNVKQAMYIAASYKGGYVATPLQRDEHILLQGEVCRCPDLYMYYSYVKLPMRRALAAKSLHAYRIVAATLLKQAMDASSYDDLMELLDLYPEAAVEFSTYSCSVGCIPNRNTVFWEVRNY